jgi:hypothetical protein
MTRWEWSEFQVKCFKVLLNRGMRTEETYLNPIGTHSTVVRDSAPNMTHCRALAREVA